MYGCLHHHRARASAVVACLPPGQTEQMEPESVAPRSQPSGRHGDRADSVGVFIIEDHQPFRAVVTAVVEASAGFAVVGEAASGEEALAGLLGRSGATVDVLLVDFHLPGIDGIETVAQYRLAGGEAVAVLLSTADEAELPPGLEQRGISAFIAKATFSKVLLAQTWDAVTAGTRD